MSHALEEMKSRIDMLPGDEQVELANYLIRKLEPSENRNGPQPQTNQTPDEIDREWRIEVRRRLEDWKSGRSVGRPLDEVLAELDREDP